MSRIQVRFGGVSSRLDSTTLELATEAPQKLVVVIRPPLWPVSTILVVAAVAWLLSRVIEVPLSPLRKLIGVGGLQFFAGCWLPLS